jgi:hypothetical protein
MVVVFEKIGDWMKGGREGKLVVGEMQLRPERW